MSFLRNKKIFTTGNKESNENLMLIFNIIRKYSDFGSDFIFENEGEIFDFLCSIQQNVNLEILLKCFPDNILETFDETLNAVKTLSFLNCNYLHDFLIYMKFKYPYRIQKTDEQEYESITGKKIENLSNDDFNTMSTDQLDEYFSRKKRLNNDLRKTLNKIIILPTYNETIVANGCHFFLPKLEISETIKLYNVAFTHNKIKNFSKFFKILNEDKSNENDKCDINEMMKINKKMFLHACRKDHSEIIIFAFENKIIDTSYIDDGMNHCCRSDSCSVLNFLMKKIILIEGDLEKFMEKTILSNSNKCFNYLINNLKNKKINISVFSMIHMSEEMAEVLFKMCSNYNRTSIFFDIYYSEYKNAKKSFKILKILLELGCHNNENIFSILSKYEFIDGEEINEYKRFNYNSDEIIELLQTIINTGININLREILLNVSESKIIDFLNSKNQLS